MTELSLVVGLGELVKGIADLSLNIKSSSSDIQNFKGYLEDSSTQLSHLQEVLASTEPEVNDSSNVSPLQVQIVQNAKRCTATVKKTESVLKKYESKHVGKSLQWAVVGRKELIKLRQDLEIQMEPLKAAVQILLLSHARLSQNNIGETKEIAETTQRDVINLRSQSLLSPKYTDDDFIKEWLATTSTKANLSLLNEQSSIFSQTSHTSREIISSDNYLLTEFDKFRMKLQELMNEKMKADSLSNAIGRQEKSILTNQSYPYTTDIFVGREMELKQLRKWISGSSTISGGVLLWGPRGVGKTRLALKFAELQRQTYDYILLLDASTKELFQSSCIDLLTSLPIPDNARSPAENVSSWLEACKKPWLLIIENLGYIPSIVSKISGLTNSGHVLITSVDPNFRNRGFVSESLAITGLNSTDSLLLFFLRSNLPTPSEDEYTEAKDLLSDLDHFPLAIDFVSAYITVTKKTIKEFSGLYRKTFPPNQATVDFAGDHAADNFLAEVLSITFKEIEHGSDDFLLLELFAFLNGHEITEEILVRGATSRLSWGTSGELVEYVPPEQFISKELLLLLKHKSRFKFATQRLKNFSLIQSHQTTQGSAFQIHYVIQNYIKANLPSTRYRIQCSVQALFFVYQSYPTSQAILYARKSSDALERSSLRHFCAVYESLYEGQVGNVVSYLKSISNEAEFLTPCERVAELFIKAHVIYQTHDRETNYVLFQRIEEFLVDSTDLYILGRCVEASLLSTTTKVTHQHRMEQLKKFIDDARIANIRGSTQLNKLENAQLGNLITQYSDYLYITPTGDIELEHSLSHLNTWSPLDETNPSTIERIIASYHHRMHARVLKDHGKWEGAREYFMMYLDLYAEERAQEEGWAGGDLVQCHLELHQTDKAEETLMKYLGIRHNTRQPEEISESRENDTTYLEMLLGECYLCQGKYLKAEQVMVRYLEKLQGYSRLHFHERYRYFFSLTVLARCYHLSGKFKDALSYWKEAWSYCANELNVGKQQGKWSEATIFPNIIQLSILDCNYELGHFPEFPDQRSRSEKFIKDSMTYWVPGLATYWLSWVQDKLITHEKKDASFQELAI